MSMGSFGEELRMERLNRGIALEKITEITKISQRHLVALEENQFRVLPGGILNKGIVRGYVNVLGLDEMDWMTRFQRAYSASGELLDDDRNWIEFAANVGRARVRPRDAATERLKWAGAFFCCWLSGWRCFLRCATTASDPAGGRRSSQAGNQCRLPGHALWWTAPAYLSPACWGEIASSADFPVLRADAAIPQILD